MSDQIERRLPPLYAPLWESLPFIYQEDAKSFAQLKSFLGLSDDLLRAYLGQLHDLLGWLSPQANSYYPPGFAPTRGFADHRARLHAVYDEMASWFGFEFPGHWAKEATIDGNGLTQEEQDAELEAEWLRLDQNLLEKKRQFLLRAPRLWRRRGTPSGFLAWFCFYFDIELLEHRPILYEHFKFRPASWANDEERDKYAHAMTLLVPIGPSFGTYEELLDASAFVRGHAPAHLLVRLCWIDPADREEKAQALENLNNLRLEELEQAKTEIRENILEARISDRARELGIHLCGDLKMLTIDQLNLGRLPSADHIHTPENARTVIRRHDDDNNGS